MPENYAMAVDGKGWRDMEQGKKASLRLLLGQPPRQPVGKTRPATAGGPDQAQREEASRDSVVQAYFNLKNPSLVEKHGCPVEELYE